MPELFIIAKTQGNSNLIQRILFQNIVQIIDGSDDLNPVVFASPFLLIIQNTPDLITPFRILLHPVHKAFCCSRISHKKNVFQVISSGTGRAENNPDRVSLCCNQEHIDNIKINDQAPGEIVQMGLLTSQIKHQAEYQYADGICL